MARRVYLIRHGEVISGERCYGQTDVALSERGRQQMLLLRQWLQPAFPGAVYGSDLLRSRESVELLLRGSALEARFLPELREIHLGAYEGKSYQELVGLLSQEMQARGQIWRDFRFPGGEGLSQLRARVIPAYRRLVAHAGGQDLAIVGHSGPNRIILCQVLGLPLRNLWRLGQDYGSVSIIEYDGRLPQVVLLNWRPGGG